MEGASYPSVSIIIPNFNGRDYLGACFGSLSKIAYPLERWEAILVDNASTDGSVEYVASEFPWVRILSMNRNYGFSAVNRGVEESRNDFVVLLNNDTRVDAHWLDRLEEASRQFGRDNIYSSKTVYMADPGRIDYCGGVIPINGRGYSPHRGGIDPQWTEIRSTGYPCAASMWVRKDVFQKLGGFDWDYFACHDDVDFGLRGWLQGHSTYVVPRSIVFHRVSGTVGGKRSYFSIYHHAKNAIQNIIKNFEIRNAIIGLIVEAAFDLYQLASFARRRHWQGIRAVLDAYRWVLKNLNTIAVKRRQIQASRLSPDSLFHELGLSADLGESIEVLRRLRA